MSPEKPEPPIRYNGRYTRPVDAKRRLQVPAKWRPKEGSVEFTVIVWPKEAAGVCLRVLPPEGLEKLNQAIDQIDNEDPRKLVLKRVIGTNSEQVSVDRAGRMCLPETMTKAAGIRDQAVLAGCLDHFQIWSPERYKSIEVSDEALAQDAFKLVP